jgi:pimeloyl-ACP methyl ester carboxylesterase
MGDLGLTLEFTLSLLVLLVLVPLGGALYQRVASARDARRFPTPGRLVDIGDCRLHVDLRGEGSPAVVFEAGIAATSLSWRLVQSEIAKVTSTASYDRAWLGWSDASRHPRTIGQVVEELHTLLDRAGLADPWILVAHSYGGLVARAYQARYAAEVAGMVLVDPMATSDWTEPSQLHRKMLRRGVLLSRRGGWLARLAVVRFALSLLAAGGRRLPKLVASASSGRGVAFIENILGEIRKLPPEVWPMIRSQWSNPKSFEGMAQYLEAVPESAAAIAKEVGFRGTLRDVPLIVLSAENASPTQRAEHESLARCSQGRIEIVPGGGHWMQLDRPDVVIRAINEIIAQARAR